MFHTFDICERIAEKLSASDKIADAFRSNPVSAEQWSERSLANGWPSLALLYSVLDIHFPHKNYDHIAHNYLKRCTTDLQGSGTFSLLHGLAGLCITTYFCSKEGDRYRHLLTQLDKLLVDKLELYLNLPEKESYPFHVYNRMHGISGVLAYLSLRQNDSVLQFYAKRCLSHLVAFINRKSLSSIIMFQVGMSLLKLFIFLETKKSIQMENLVWGNRVYRRPIRAIHHGARRNLGRGFARSYFFSLRLVEKKERRVCSMVPLGPMPSH